MQLQSLFDTVCRCFGHQSSVTTSVATQPYEQPESTTNSQSHDVRRRANRVELKNEEFDALFEDSKGKRSGSSSPRNGRATAQQESELAYAKAVAQAKLAANPSRYRSKRKRSAKSRDEIFRSKESQEQPNPSVPLQETTFARLLNPTVALCFATPVRGTEEEPDEEVLKSHDGCDNSDTNTLNTCEDTITSTLYFDSKYSHIVETRPPMPLFSQFKLKHERDEIRNIVATDSHSSVRMIKLLQQQADAPMHVRLDNSSSDSDDHHLQHQQQQHHHKNPPPPPPFKVSLDEQVPDVKAASSSTDSSRRSKSFSSQQDHYHR